jgi:phosphoglucosamine mutase
LLALFGVYALGTDTLKAKTLVATIQSNLGLDHAIRDAGGFVERTDVGDRNVATCMRGRGANIGGENSGHIIFSDFATTGDSLLAALKVIELMCKTGKKLSTLREEIRLLPQMTLNLRVTEKIPLAELSKLPAAIAKLETDFGADGRILIRYSGTAPKLRMLVEGKDEKVIAAAMKALETPARAELEVLDPPLARG